MRFYSVSLISVLLILVTVKAEQDDVCTSYYGSKGKCISLKSCPFLLNILTKEMISKTEVEILQQSNCGFNGSIPLVCCPERIPKENSNSNSTNENRVPTVNTTPVTNNTQTTLVTTTVPSIAPTKKPQAQATIATTTTATENSKVTGPVGSVQTKPPAQHPLLPAECGIVLNFKHFFGNRTEFDDFPWTVLIQYDTPKGTLFGCGGSLISNRYVLTAGHCVSSLYPMWKIKGVRIGEYDISTKNDCYSNGVGDICMDNTVDVGVEDQIVHPDFKPYDTTRLHDIAILRLAEEIPFSTYVKPICLPLKPPGPQRFYTSGWGKTCERDGTNLKYMSYLTEMKQEECFEKYSWADVKLYENQICAGSKPTERPCIGDDGGPLMGVEPRENGIHGVAVFGVFTRTHPDKGVCARSDWPGVYTKVYDYVPWIVHQLRK